MTCIAGININFLLVGFSDYYETTGIIVKITKTVEKLDIYLSVNCKTSSNTQKHEVNSGVYLKNFSVCSSYSSIFSIVRMFIIVFNIFFHLFKRPPRKEHCAVYYCKNNGYTYHNSNNFLLDGR